MKRSLIALALFMVGCSGKPAETAKKTEPAKPFKVDPATAGTITGTISFSGKKPKPEKITVDEDSHCAEMQKAGLYDQAVVVNENGTLANVFVYIKKGLEGKSFEPPAEAVVIDQKGCTFQPRVIGLQTGQYLNVTNSDPTTHSIHPVAQINREWNQAQEPGAEPLHRRFMTREVMIRVKCNIHSWMRAWIGAVEHPYFSVTGTDGSFELKNVPPGEYTVEAWHEKYGTQEMKVTVPPSGTQQAAFTFKGE
jgi:plastocyanin